MLTLHTDLVLVCTATCELYTDREPEVEVMDSSGAWRRVQGCLLDTGAKAGSMVHPEVLAQLGFVPEEGVSVPISVSTL